MTQIRKNISIDEALDTRLREYAERTDRKMSAVIERALTDYLNRENHIKTNADKMRGQAAPLHNQYPGQSDPQGAYIEIDPAERTAYADWNAEVGNAVPMSVWHNRKLRIAISPCVHGPALADWLKIERVQSTINRIVAGHSVEWDGNNMVGRMTEDAVAACDELESMSRELPDVAVWDVEDYLQHVISATPDWSEPEQIDIEGIDCQITSATTDHEIAQAAQCIITEFEFDSRGGELQAINGGYDAVYEYIESLRDQCAAENEQ